MKLNCSLGRYAWPLTCLLLTAASINAQDLQPAPAFDDAPSGGPEDRGGHILKSAPVPAGVDEGARSTAWVYPVPTSDELHVDTDGKATWAALTDAGGRPVLQQRLREARNTIDLSKLPAGLYTLHLIGPERRESHSVVKR